MSQDYLFDIAFQEAESAFNRGEVPIGAVLFNPNNGNIYRSGNRVEELENPSAHAEFLVIQDALKSYKYLYDYELYVTVEPCVFCGSAVFLSRISAVWFGAYNKKDGFSSVYKMDEKNVFNHRLRSVEGGFRVNEAEKLLKNFFSHLRRV